MTNLLDALLDRLGARLDSHGRAHTDCPQCGAPPARHTGARAYHFYLYDLPGGIGASCWVCGGRWPGSKGLRALAAMLDLRGDYTAPAPRPAIDRTPPPWARTDDALERYQTAQEARGERYAAWTAYKPLEARTIDRAQLGLGRVPLWHEPDKRHPQGYWYESDQRLLVPLVEGGRMVGIRGRALAGGWLTGSGSASILYGLEDLRPGCDLVICENMIDRLLAEQESGCCALAPTNGVAVLRHLKPEWLAAIVRARPRQVLVWLDHDLAGNGSRYHQREMVERWRAGIAERRAADPARYIGIPWPEPPTPAGPLVANQLLAAGLRARLYDWPRGTPFGHDLGDVVVEQMRRQAA